MWTLIYLRVCSCACDVCCCKMVYACVFVGKEMKCVCVHVLGFFESELVVCTPLCLELSAGPGGYVDSLGLSP